MKQKQAFDEGSQKKIWKVISHKANDDTDPDPIWVIRLENILPGQNQFPQVRRLYALRNDDDEEDSLNHLDGRDMRELTRKAKDLIWEMRDRNAVAEQADEAASS